jgi:hypothetical protein
MYKFTTLELTTKEKIYVLNQVVKIVEKTGGTCLDAFISILSEILMISKEHKEDMWIFNIRKYFPEVRNENIVIKNPKYRYGWLEQYAWLKNEKRKKQIVRFLRKIREIYIQKYLEEIKNKPIKNKIPEGSLVWTISVDKKGKMKL